MTRDELRENVRCSLFDEQDTDAVMADVDRYVKALLQQTKCYTALEFLEQMLSKEQKDFGEHYFITDEVREKMSNIKTIQSVIQLIKERQANAV